MKKHQPKALLALLALSAALPVAHSQSPAPNATLPAPVAQVLNAQHVPTSALSVVVRDINSGETVLDLNGAAARSPASTIKVVTTYAALDNLGPNYVWTTQALGTGPVVDGHLKGDLILKGGGDPFMTDERWEHFARQLRLRGVTHIDGDIVIDNSIFEAQNSDPDDFDGKGYKPYNVLPDALLVNLQTADFHFVPEHGRIRIVMDPAPDNFKVINKVTTLQSACRAGAHGLRFENESANEVTISGQLSINCTDVVLSRAIMRAPDFAYGTFIGHFRALGGSFNGHMKISPTPPDAYLLTSMESLTLGEIIRLINKYSNNPMARGLLLTLGAEHGEVPGSVQKGGNAVSEWMTRRAINCPGLILDNGSGLSRLARISAECMTEIIQSASKNRYFPEFAASLPLGGEDGTLRHRFKETKGEARIRMKTGHLKDVAALTGLVITTGGRNLAVTVFVNHPGAEYGPGDEIINSVVHWVMER